MTNQNLDTDEYLYTLTASPDFPNDGILFAAKSTGLYRSTDRGQSWTFAFESLGLETILPTTSVTFSPNFAVDKIVFAAVEGNILRTTDGGDTWKYAELAKPAPLVSVLGIAPDFSERSLLLAGTLDDGILRSSNRSVTWQRWNFGLLDPHIYALCFSPDGNIFAGVESGIFCSTNDGRAWREVDFPMDLAPVISLASSGNIIFAGTEEYGLHISKDGGNTWEQLAADTIQGAVIQVITDQSGVLAVLEDALYYSQDLGKSWQARKLIEINYSITSVAAPLGLSPEHPLWVGLSTGDVVHIGGG